MPRWFRVREIVLRKSLGKPFQIALDSSDESRELLAGSVPQGAESLELGQLDCCKGVSHQPCLTRESHVCGPEGRPVT